MTKKVDHTEKFPSDPPEWNGVDLRKLKERHRSILRELVASEFNYEEVANKFEFHVGSIYRIASYEKSRAYLSWLAKGDRDGQIASAQEVLERLTSIAREDTYDVHITPKGQKVVKKVDNRDSLKALELLGKSHALFIDKIQQSQETTIVVDIDMSDDTEFDQDQETEE
ncbi:hypothetical protein [Bacillus pseudomycoides]|uniref:hypothetical protein n=1 Tax=Bacillus pseudomycoides TaxID=64104 RepID=UPI000BF748EB|nr:hypothetical protein [Bacillus pseudomycoides]PEP86084.1 hypothetical protein CN584_08480 [Bacillus pseudomycoides]PFY57631.1 hypothetical protein COL49_15095 [Bacillus pseudomycoides]PGE00050.1 hypothetical protein COM50_07190 [Bacillus pseudomycoides]PHE19190.1 hypothetical protein COF59_08150 [Bacillus pseudomycoides]